MKLPFALWAFFFFYSWLNGYRASTFNTNAPSVFITNVANLTSLFSEWRVKSDGKIKPSGANMLDLFTKAV